MQDGVLGNTVVSRATWHVGEWFNSGRGLFVSPFEWRNPLRQPFIREEANRGPALCHAPLTTSVKINAVYTISHIQRCSRTIISPRTLHIRYKVRNRSYYDCPQTFNMNNVHCWKLMIRETK